MKAVVITRPGTPDVLELVEMPDPLPYGHEVLIDVKAAGVNRPDIAQRKGNYPPPPDAPQSIPGLEVAGTVDTCGELVTKWKPGDRVCALVSGGGYATRVLADSRLCLPIPRDVSFEEASSIPETYFTVWHNVFQRGRLLKGEKFLVHGGSGGIGNTAIQLAKAWEATVYATAGSDEKCAQCKSLGASLCINYRKDDFEKVLQSEKIDVILDSIGGDYIRKNLNIINNDGRLIFINAISGGTLDVSPLEIMRKRILVSGSTLRNRDVLFKAALASEVEKNVWPLFKSGRLKVNIYRTFPLENAKGAHEMMESGEHFGKIILVPK